MIIKGRGYLVKLSFETVRQTKRPFKCYVMHMGVGGGSNFPEKAFRRCKVQRHLALQGGGWGSHFQEKGIM